MWHVLDDALIIGIVVFVVFVVVFCVLILLYFCWCGDEVLCTGVLMWWLFHGGVELDGCN